MEHKNLNFFELINDISVYIITFHFLLFTDFVSDMETQYLIGFSCITFVVLNILFNMSLVIRNIANSIRLCLTLVLRIAKAKFSKHYKVFKLKQAAK